MLTLADGTVTLLLGTAAALDRLFEPMRAAVAAEPGPYDALTAALTD